jgi:hypothetical protein
VAIAAATDYFELAAGTWLDLAEILHSAGKKAEAAVAARQALKRTSRRAASSAQHVRPTFSTQRVLPDNRKVVAFCEKRDTVAWFASLTAF